MFSKNLAFPVGVLDNPFEAVDRNPTTTVMNDLQCLEPKEQTNINFTRKHSPGQNTNFAMFYLLITVYWKLIW